MWACAGLFIAAATTPGTVLTEGFRYRTLGLRFRQGL